MVEGSSVGPPVKHCSRTRNSFLILSTRTSVFPGELEDIRQNQNRKVQFAQMDLGITAHFPNVWACVDDLTLSKVYFFQGKRHLLRGRVLGSACSLRVVAWPCAEGSSPKCSIIHKSENWSSCERTKSTRIDWKRKLYCLEITQKKNAEMSPADPKSKLRIRAPSRSACDLRTLKTRGQRPPTSTSKI